MKSTTRKTGFMRRYVIFIALGIILTSMLTGCQKQANTATADKTVSQPTTEIVVSSAPSLKTSFEQIKNLYASQKPNVKLTLNYGPSGSLKNQIEQGANADVFISQGKKDMDELEQKGLLKDGSRIKLLSDELVLIVSKNNTTINGFTDLTKPEVKKIGIGEANTVPAAKTAQETLQTLQLWQSLQNKLVVGKDLMQITSWVESGDADAGFVWDTIAKTSDKVKVVATAPAGSHQPVVIPAAVVSSSKNSAEAAAFLKYLQSDEAMQVFIKNGFVKPN